MASGSVVAGEARFDEQDVRILEEFQKDASRPYKELARVLGMRTTTVFERVKRLKEKGIIRAIVPLLDHEGLGLRTTAWVHVRVAPGSDCCGISRRIAAFPEALEVHEVAGEWDILLKAKVRDNTELHELTNRVGRMEGVVMHQSTLAVKTFREDLRVGRLGGPRGP